MSGQGEAPTATVVLTPVGSPLPLGFLGLAAATVLVSGLQLEWLSVNQGVVVAWCLLAFTVPLQLTACLFGFHARDAVAGTGMGVLFGTWAAVAATILVSPPGSTSKALGLMLLVAALALAVPAGAAASGKLLGATVMGFAAVRLALTGVVQLGADAWSPVAGVMGLALGAIALYAALAYELEDTQGRTVLPTWRRGDALTAFTGTLAEQATGVEHEAGVRKQL